MNNELVFTTTNGVCICGTNRTTYGNAAKYPSLIAGKIVIPLKHNGEYVKEIGCFAFFRCVYITEVFIEARLTKIHERAF